MSPILIKLKFTKEKEEKIYKQMEEKGKVGKQMENRMKKGNKRGK